MCLVYPKYSGRQLPPKIVASGPADLQATDVQAPDRAGQGGSAGSYDLGFRLVRCWGAGFRGCLRKGCFACS